MNDELYIKRLSVYISEFIESGKKFAPAKPVILKVTNEDTIKSITDKYRKYLKNNAKHLEICECEPDTRPFHINYMCSDCGEKRDDSLDTAISYLMIIKRNL